MPSSRPMPDSFMPPNGHCGVAGTGSLMPMMPASRPSAIRVATVRSLVKTYAARPYGVLLAAAITSSSFEKSSSGMTGANGSSVMIFMPPLTSRRIGRLEPEALVEPGRAAAAGQDLGTLAAGVVDELGGLFERLGLEHRADLHAVFEAVADLELLGQLDGGLGEFLGDLLVDVEPRRGDADLAVVAELAEHGGLRDLLDVGVGKDDQRGVTAELEAEPLDLSAERRISSLPTSVEPVKLILRTAGCSKKTSASAPRRARCTRLATPGGQAGVGQALEHLDQASAASGRPAGSRRCSPPPAPAAILRLGRAAGKFQGVIVQTTPTGCLIA